MKIILPTTSQFDKRPTGKYPVNKGLTIIELLVALALFASVFVVANSLLVTTFRSARKSAAISRARLEGSYILNSIIQNIKFASRVGCATANQIFVASPSGSITYRFDQTNSRILANGVQVAGGSGARVTIRRPAACPAVFTCTGTDVNNAQTVDICFTVESVQDFGFGGSDVTSFAGSGGSGIIFRGSARLRNFGN